MANTKISALTPGGPAVGSDQVPIARSGANFSLTAANIAALAAVQSVAGRTGAVVLSEADITNLTTDLAAKANVASVTAETVRATAAEALLAPLASPALTGTPTAPTATTGTDTTQIATTAFVEDAIDNLAAGDIPNIAESQVTSLVSDLALKAPLASPALTGAPTAPTATALDNSTKVATTAYTDAAVATEKTRALAAEALLAPVSPALDVQTASYTAVLADATQLVTMNVAGANNFTVPPNASVAFPIGTTLTILQLGAGQVTLVPGAGVTISTAATLTARAQYSIVSVTKIAVNTWIAAGDLT